MLSTIAWASEDEFNVDRLPIGNPNTKYDFCAVKLNRIFDTNANKEVKMDKFIEMLKNFRVVMVGESHTSEQNHIVQLKIIKGLVEAGSTVCLALEMFNESQKQALKNYISGKSNEQEFLDQSNYFNTWGHNYRYYKPIFDYAKEKKIKMFGVNIEHNYASKIGRGGTKSLTPEELKALPKIDTTNVEHRFFIKVAMEGMDATVPAQFKKIYAAQSLWDAAMGDGAIKVATENPDAVVVLLAGSGHVVYNLGIGNIIKKRSKLSFASVVAVDVPDTVKESLMMKVKKSIKKEEKKDEKAKSVPKKKKMPPMSMMRSMGAVENIPFKIVVRSLADFLWGIPEEKKVKYPSFGFSVTKKGEKGFEVKRVIPETIAEKQGIKKSDIILSIDGENFDDMAKLKKHLHFKNWNDQISFNILREEQEIKIQFVIEPVEEKE
jgi:uncharacterized iron-regulated protein